MDFYSAFIDLVVRLVGTVVTVRWLWQFQLALLRILKERRNESGPDKI